MGYGPRPASPRPLPHGVPPPPPPVLYDHGGDWRYTAKWVAVVMWLACMTGLFLIWWHEVDSRVASSFESARDGTF